MPAILSWRPSSYTYDSGRQQDFSSHLSTATTSYNACAIELLADSTTSTTATTQRATSSPRSERADRCHHHLLSTIPTSQLVRIDFPDGTSASYRYDGVGRRIVKDRGWSRSTQYVYDEQRHPRSSTRRGAWSPRYTHTPEGLDRGAGGRTGRATVTYLQADAVGSIGGGRWSDGSGAVAELSTTTPSDGRWQRPVQRPSPVRLPGARVRLGVRPLLLPRSLLSSAASGRFLTPGSDRASPVASTSTPSCATTH